MNQSEGQDFESVHNNSLGCPDYGSSGEELLENLCYVLEGILQSSIASLGLFCNLIACVVLAAKEMRNSFNLLLIALAIFDSGYLVGSILESFRKSFQLTTTAHIILFPHFLFPGQTIMMSASVFMTVAISMERYVAVHYPVQYNQAMNDSRATLRRVMKYIIPVVIFSFIFNIPKFFESEVTYETNDSNSSYEIYLEVTQFRKNPDYAVYYNNWARLVVLGIIPVVLLVYFNLKIYVDIQSRKCRMTQSHSMRTDAGNEGQSIRSRDRVLGSLRFRENSQVNVNRTTTATNRNNNRRRQEDNLATVFMGIVLMFLISHLPRVFLSLHEMFIINQVLMCTAAGERAFPLWALIVGCFSHLLLVINSSGNCLIYCILSPKFRNEFSKYVEPVIRLVGGVWQRMLSLMGCCNKDLLEADVNEANIVNGDIENGNSVPSPEEDEKSCEQNLRRVSAIGCCILNQLQDVNEFGSSNDVCMSMIGECKEDTQTNETRHLQESLTKV